MPASRRTQDKVAERRLAVLTMRAGGATYEQIAGAGLGHKSPAAVVQDATRALESRSVILRGQAHLLVALEMERLDRLDRIVNGIIAAAANPDSRDHDPALALRAIDRAVRISYRRAALTGTDERPLAPAAAPDDADKPERSEIDELATARANRRRAAHR